MTALCLLCSSGAPRAASLWGQPCRSVVGRGLAHALGTPGATTLFLHHYTRRDPEEGWMRQRELKTNVSPWATVAFGNLKEWWPKVIKLAVSTKNNPIRILTWWAQAARRKRYGRASFGDHEFESRRFHSQQHWCVLSGRGEGHYSNSSQSGASVSSSSVGSCHVTGESLVWLVGIGYDQISEKIGGKKY